MVVVRAKMRCVTKREDVYNDGTKGYAVKLIPVMEGSAENREFFRWTPGGSVELGTLNSTAAAEFVEGQEYYIDFTHAAPP